MKTKTSGKKLANPGKVGMLAGKAGRQAPQKAQNMNHLDAPQIGSAMGILSKHHK